LRSASGSPAVLVVLIDDAGFGAIETFGGPIASPTFTRVQQMGITYSAFHVTAARPRTGRQPRSRDAG